MEKKYTAYVIRYNKCFLKGVKDYGDCKLPEFTSHKYDAARIREESAAREIARKIGGRVQRFNWITGETTVA